MLLDWMREANAADNPRCTICAQQARILCIAQRIALRGGDAERVCYTFLEGDRREIVDERQQSKKEQTSPEAPPNELLFNRQQRFAGRTVEFTANISLRHDALHMCWS